MSYSFVVYYNWTDVDSTLEFTAASRQKHVQYSIIIHLHITVLMLLEPKNKEDESPQVKNTCIFNDWCFFRTSQK